jgi:hypothetical protein
MPAYSGKAQPYLDAIAESDFTSQDVRDWLIAGTACGGIYAGSRALIDEQRGAVAEKADQAAILGELLVRTRQPLHLPDRGQQGN